MAESWRRLSEKSGRGIRPHDILLINHELLEIRTLIDNSGISQMKAHSLANKIYNYQKAADAYYISIGVKVR